MRLVAPQVLQQNRMTMSGFTLRVFYPLLHVFDETGHAMYGRAWTSWEAWARDYGDPDATRLARKATIDALNELPAKEAELALVVVDQSDFEAVNEQGAKFQVIYAERKRLKQSLHELPEISDSWIADAEKFQRRCSVENTLREAFRAGDLTLLHGPSTVVEWDKWANSTDFRVYYSLSMIRAPNHPHFATRRAPGLIKRTEFDQWIKRFGIKPEGEESLTPGAQCINWLREEVAEGPKQKTKDAYRIAAMAKIYGLTRREFNRCWANETPANWKASGPLRK
jgi:hypothetical protein